jgi:uncharacterized repeat protein (TIGR01451 family)
MKIAFSKRRKARWFNSVWLFLAMLLHASSAYAVIVNITGGSANSANPTVVKYGERIHLTGSCTQESATETRGWARYFIRSGANFKLLSGSSIVSWLDSSTQDVVVGSTPLAGADGADFNVTLQCTDHVQKQFSATVYFRLAAASPPATEQIAPIVDYAAGDVTVSVNATDTGDGVREVFILWPAAPSREERMTHVSGDLYQYTIATQDLPEGPVGLQIWANSEHYANNGWVDIRGFIVDRSPPTLSSASISQSGDNATVTISANDNLAGVNQLWIRWNTGSGWSPDTSMTSSSSGRYAYAIDTRGMPSGAKAIQIWGRDNAGNNTGWTNKGSFTVDRIAPEITWDSTNRTYAGAGGITIKADVSDAVSGVKDVWITWTGETTRNLRMTKGSGNQYFYAIPALPDGVKKVEIWATDNVGNTTNWVEKGRFTADRTAPKIQWDSTNPAYAGAAGITIKADISDAVSGVRDVWITWTGESTGTLKMTKGRDNRYFYAIPALSDGVKKVEIWATDNAGNASNWIEEGRFTVDRTAPALSWLAPLDQATLSGDSIRVAGNLVDANPDFVTIEWQAEDDTAWQSQVVPIATDSDAFQYDLSGLNQGVNYRLRLFATDKAGNIAETTPPRTVIGQFKAHDLFKNALLAVLENSTADKDNSGGLSDGDSFIYRVQAEVGKATARGVSLHYALPPGLAPTPGALPYFAAESSIGDNRKLNARWNGNSEAQLLRNDGSVNDDVDLAAGGKLVLDIPVTVIAGAAISMQLPSTVQLGAKNAKDDLAIEHRLILQEHFPAGQALQLKLESLQADWKYKQGTTFDYRITVQMKKWPLSGLRLDYALPQGLLKNGEVRISGPSAATVTLNPEWQENGGKLLLSSAPGVMLEARNSLTVIIPVRVSATPTPGNFVQSEIQAGADNLDAPVSAIHRIVLEDSHEPEQQLVLKKTVKKTGAAAPGDVLHYTLTFSNVGTDDLHDLVIRDTIQNDYLTLQDTQCGIALPRTLRCCISSGRGKQCGAGTGQQSGKLEWRLQGTLEAGDSGSVSYDVLINRR